MARRLLVAQVDLKAWTRMSFKHILVKAVIHKKNL